MVPFEYKPPIENTTRASREPPPLNNLSTCPHKCCVFWLFSWIILVFLSGRIALAAAAAKSLQSCPTLCDPRDGSPPGSPVPGILQARTLEWVAISFSNAWKWKVKVKSLSRVRPSATPHGLQPARLLHVRDFPGKSIGVGCHAFSNNTG